MNARIINMWTIGTCEVSNLHSSSISVPKTRSVMDYLQKYLEDLEQVPPHLRQEFKIMRDLDHKVQELLNETQIKTNFLIQQSSQLSTEERSRRIREIQELFVKGREISNDKVSRAENVYELVDKQIRRLDADMFEFKKALAEKELKKLKKSQKKSDLTGSSKIPATAALALALTNNPGEVLDMPVDPNEPTYCLCQQVSYGEMVACDHRDCPIEWFHFGCVGLTSKPKGLLGIVFWCLYLSAMPIRPPKTPRLSSGSGRRGSGGIHMPFKSPLRARNTPDGSSLTPVPKPENSIQSVTSPRVDPRSVAASSKVAQNNQDEPSTTTEQSRQLDQKIDELKLRICELRGIKDVNELDVEAELKCWRELLHEYNEVKDACLFLLGKLAHAKMTTVKDLYRHFGLDVND
ncbi:Inhibitor of growth protein 4 [Sparganum proliferum]